MEAKRKVQKSNSSNAQQERKKSTINLRKKVQSVKDLRAGKLLSTFAKHFIDMVRSSNEYRAYPQSFMYLLLAGNMATLLEETGNGMDAIELRKEIEELNTASRGGVRDMLASSWVISDDYDIIQRNQSHRGSNWELKESQPLPQPPKEASPNAGLKFSSRNNYATKLGSNLASLDNTINTRPAFLRADSEESDMIVDLPDSAAQTSIIIETDDDEFGSTYL